MPPGDWTEADVKNGLRTASGALVGGLDVLDYSRGGADFASGTPPPEITSASYDLGRRRAAEEAELKADVLAALERDRRETDARVRELLRDHPAELAEYDAAMQRIAAKQI